MTLSHAQSYGLQQIADSDAEFIIGVDEVGVGACAGPLVVCAITFPAEWTHPKVKDSKKFSGGGERAHRKRLEVLHEVIYPHLVSYELAVYTHTEVDEVGMYHAVEDCTRRVAIAESQRQPDSVVVVDGNYFPRLTTPKKVLAFPKADILVPAVSAASILAKTHRDEIMLAYGREFPGYGFEDHMGYPTPAHLEALHGLGPCPIHRRSYSPVSNACARFGVE